MITDKIFIHTQEFNDGYKWQIEIDGVIVLESIRTHLEEVDAVAASRLWMDRLGFNLVSEKSNI